MPKPTKARARAEKFFGVDVTLYRGDNRDVLAQLPANSVDGCLCDPPYHLQSVIDRYSRTGLVRDGTNEARARGRSDAIARHFRGFMGQRWDGGDVSFDPETWRAVYRVLKPGAWLIAFGGTRTSHAVASAIEAAGFDIRDTVYWIYGQGLPKSINVALSIEQMICRKQKVNGQVRWYYWSDGRRMRREAPFRTKGANLYAGYGSALKPAIEPAIVARKPFPGTLLQNLQKWGTGALNVDACRIAASDQAKLEKQWNRSSQADIRGGAYVGSKKRALMRGRAGAGRWPANIIHDGSPDVVAAFPRTKSGTGAIKKKTAAGHRSNSYGAESRAAGTEMITYGDAGSAARFFWSAKAGKEDRAGSDHPTVKPISALRYLVRLIKPPKPGAVILDCFAGTGTTGQACHAEGVRAILIEREPGYCAHIRERMRRIAAHG